MAKNGRRKKLTVEEYLQKCRDECSSRLADKSFFYPDSLQQNALRVETLRDMSPRCGEKMPEHWHKDAKARGWGMWIFSGGTAAVFGHCDSDCPLRNFFLRTAPYKHLRKLAAPEPSADACLAHWRLCVPPERD